MPLRREKLVSQTDDLDFIAAFSAMTTLVAADLPVMLETHSLAMDLVADKAAQERLRRDVEEYHTMRKAMDFDTLRQRAADLGIDPYAAVRGYVTLTYGQITIDEVLVAFEATGKRVRPS